MKCSLFTIIFLIIINNAIYQRLFVLLFWPLLKYKLWTFQPWNPNTIYCSRQN